MTIACKLFETFQAVHLHTFVKGAKNTTRQLLREMSPRYGQEFPSKPLNASPPILEAFSVRDYEEAFEPEEQLKQRRAHNNKSTKKIRAA